MSVQGDSAEYGNAGRRDARKDRAFIFFVVEGGTRSGVLTEDCE